MWLEVLTPPVLLAWWFLIITCARDNEVRRRVEIRFVVDLTAFARSLREMAAAFERSSAAIAAMQKNRGG